MNTPLNHLEKQIMEKNVLLDSLNKMQRYNKEKITNVKTELDNLLYLYYKSIRSHTNDAFVLWSEGV